MIVERSSPRLRFSSINVVRAIIAELLQMMCGLGDNPFRRYAPLPLLSPSQIGVGIRRGHPRSSQIGVHFSKKIYGWRSFFDDGDDPMSRDEGDSVALSLISQPKHPPGASIAPLKTKAQPPF